MDPLFAVVNHPVVNLRDSPSPKGEVVSQTFFSEPISKIDEQQNWLLISTPDNYRGWIPSETAYFRATPYNGSLSVSRLAAHLYSTHGIEWGPLYTLPLGASLQLVDFYDERWIKVALPDETIAYIQRGDVTPEAPFKKKEELTRFSLRFQGLPYTWGGRTSFGYDCSGFVQMLYQRLNICLERDSQQQSKDPRFITVPPSAIEAGDLIFFGHHPQQIRHVGMCLDQTTFIHATSRENQPWIRISHLSDPAWNGGPQAIYPYSILRQLKIKALYSPSN